MSVYKRQGRKFYIYDFNYRGQRFSGSTGCTSKREAERFEEAERERVKALRIDASKPLTFKAAAAQYWNEVARHRADSEDLLRCLDWLITNIGETTPIAEISNALIARLVAKRRGEYVPSHRKPGRKYKTPEQRRLVSNATVNRTVTQPLREILRRARRTWGQTVQEIEWKDHWLKEPQERVREASADEEARLLSAIRGDYAPALRFAILTGCRRAEIVGLTWKDVDFFNREFTVRGKGDRVRTIPMTTAIHSLLWELRHNHKEAVFTYQVRRPRNGAVKGTRQPITAEGFKTEWRRTRARAGVEDFRFHDSRHTAATRLVRATGNLKMAQQLLGHTEIATTARYAHVTRDDLRAGMESVNAPAAKKVRGKRNTQ